MQVWAFFFVIFTATLHGYWKATPSLLVWSGCSCMCTAVYVCVCVCVINHDCVLIVGLTSCQDQCLCALYACSGEVRLISSRSVGVSLFVLPILCVCVCVSVSMCVCVCLPVPLCCVF